MPTNTVRVVGNAKSRQQRRAACSKRTFAVHLPFTRKSATPSFAQWGQQIVCAIFDALGDPTPGRICDKQHLCPIFPGKVLFCAPVQGAYARCSAHRQKSHCIEAGSGLSQDGGVQVPVLYHAQPADSGAATIVAAEHVLASITPQRYHKNAHGYCLPTLEATSDVRTELADAPAYLTDIQCMQLGDANTLKEMLLPAVVQKWHEQASSTCSAATMTGSEQRWLNELIQATEIKVEGWEQPMTGCDPGPGAHQGCAHVEGRGF